MKKVLSLALTLVLCLGLATPAFAAETAIELTPLYSKEAFTMKLSDLTSREVIEETSYSSKTLYRVPQGTTVQLDFKSGSYYVVVDVMYGSEFNGRYSYDSAKVGAPLYHKEGYAPNTPITLDQPGLIYFNISGDMGAQILKESSAIFFEVAGGTATEPPAAPAQTAQPAATAPAVGSGYEQMGVWCDTDRLLVFDEARREDTTTMEFDGDESFYEQAVIILHVKPGSLMRAVDANETPVDYDLDLDSSVYEMDGFYLPTFFTETEYTDQEQIFNMWSTPYRVTNNSTVDGLFAKLQENHDATQKALGVHGNEGTTAMLRFWNATDEGPSVLVLVALDGDPIVPATPTAPAQPSTPAEPVTPAQPTVAVPADAITYTVQKYDTMGQIALNYYGSLACHKALTNANAEAFKATNGALKPGMTLILPAALGKTVRLAPAAAGAGETLYTVQAGDTLGAIARKAYGDAKAYKTIFERNSDRLKDANMIYVGQVIVLPAK